MKNITESALFKRTIIIAVMVIVCFTITWRFFPILWLPLAFIDIVVLIIYTINIIRSLIFWILERKNYNNSFMPLCIALLPILIIVAAPSMDLNKSYYKSTTYLNALPDATCKCGLYIETYLIRASYMATDINALYLTDHKNFRQLEGTYDEGNEALTTDCKGDTIIIEKYVRETLGINAGSYKLDNKKVCSLKHLKEAKVFE